MPQELSLTWSEPLSLVTLIINLGVGTLLSFILAWHFQRFGSTLSNRKEFTKVIPFIMLTIILIITVVKSSLALSLGLVGALSIVRFRTPIKEPEELAYLFAAIALGLGLGANQTVATLVAAAVILGVMTLVNLRRGQKEDKNLYLSLDWRSDDGAPSDSIIDQLNEIILKRARRCNLQRFDLRAEGLEATYYVDFEDAGSLDHLIDDLRGQFPNMGVTFLDQNQLPGV